MNEKQLDEILDEMYAMFSIVPSPEHEPKRFAYYVKLYRYLKGKQ
jgi:hypothetical protein